ncbi:MAG: DNA mismatch repair endonuclease MutL [Lachnospiraceae bacterium]|nr:DNA mismatch repair endonuclease MutL [Lachnospiraceae bacterium]
MVRREIALLDKETIDQIAAGEVVERPASVVKELVENAVDAGADAITVEIKDGGKSYIRISDNGCGIPKEQLAVAFMRHATSKLRQPEELINIQSLGFRGEALSSISAVSMVEMITKPEEQLMGCRYVIEGSQEKSLEEVGAPNGTTIMVHQLFYNTPARQKFLKSDITEGGYIGELMERLALSNPDVSFSFISNRKERLHTAGNGNLWDTIYQVYGKEIAANIIPVSVENDKYHIEGFMGNATVARGNRSLENFFVNGRYVKSPLLSKALESGYAGFLMQHQYPFCVLSINTKASKVDVNVHPTKQEVRFDDEATIVSMLTETIKEHLSQKEDIAEITVEEQQTHTEVVKEVVVAEKKTPVTQAEPFEKNKLQQIRERVTAEIHKDTPYERKYQDFYAGIEQSGQDTTYEQTTFLSEEAKKTHRIIGQVFDTYWLVEYDNKLYIIDQHAAHEKVLYEKMIHALDHKSMTSQQISPPVILSLSQMEQQVLNEYQDIFEEIGFAISSFGGSEFALTAVPGNLFSLDYRQIFMEILSDCNGQKRGLDATVILEKVASMSCKAAVKGNQRLSMPEVEQLIQDLLSLDNPYHCPHGRPTIISLSQYELEKKFRRIV